MVKAVPSEADRIAASNAQNAKLLGKGLEKGAGGDAVGDIVDPAVEAQKAVDAAKAAIEAGKAPAPNKEHAELRAAHEKLTRERGRERSEMSQLRTENEALRARLDALEAASGKTEGEEHPATTDEEKKLLEAAPKKEEEAAKPEGAPKTIEEVFTPEELDGLGKKFREKGTLDQGDYDRIGKAFNADKKMVDTYIRAQQVLADVATDALYSVFGGKPGYDKAAQAASAHLSSEEIDAVNHLIKQNDPAAAKAAGKMLKRLIEAATGKAAPYLGRSAGGQAGVSGFRSHDEMMAAMRDPRFKGAKADPAFVRETLAKRDAYYEAQGVPSER